MCPKTALVAVACLAWGCAAEPPALMPSAAVETPDAGAAPQACTSPRTYFAREVWGPVLAENCFKCHSVDGVAVLRDRARFVLQPPTYPGFLDENLRNVREIAKIEYEGQSELLLKPTGGMGHGGGAVLDPANRDVLRARGRVIWLRARPETLAERVGDGDGRPLLADGVLETLTRLTAERAPAYEAAAHAAVDTDGLSLDEVVTRVLGAFAAEAA